MSNGVKLNISLLSSTEHQKLIFEVSVTAYRILEDYPVMVVTLGVDAQVYPLQIALFVIFWTLRGIEIKP